MFCKRPNLTKFDTKMKKESKDCDSLSLSLKPATSPKILLNDINGLKHSIQTSANLKFSYWRQKNVPPKTHMLELEDTFKIGI